MLTESEKKVVKAFVAERPADSRLLQTDGRKLEKHGLGSEVVARWTGGRISIVSTESVKSDESIIRLIVKEAGPGVVDFSYARKGHRTHAHGAMGRNGSVPAIGDLVIRRSVLKSEHPYWIQQATRDGFRTPNIGGNEVEYRSPEDAFLGAGVLQRELGTAVTVWINEKNDDDYQVYSTGHGAMGRNGRTQLDRFARAFFEAALWSSSDESDDSGGEPLDKNHSVSDIDEHSLAGLAAECERFQEENATDLEDLDSSQSGHDFWLTRNRHGAGFWDRGYPKDQAQRLTDASHAYGEVDLYLGDPDEDGEVVIYASGYEAPRAQTPNARRSKLPSQRNDPSVRRDVLTDFMACPDIDEEHTPEAFFEHDAWWVQCNCGAQWSVVDTKNGFDFEQVSQGDEGFHGDSYESNPRGSTVDEHAATELSLYIENEYSLIGAPNSIGKSIDANLRKKIAAGTYDQRLAPKAWLYLIEAGAKKYTKELGGGSFNLATRMQVAKDFAIAWEQENLQREPLPGIGSGGLRQNPEIRPAALTREQDFPAQAAFIETLQPLLDPIFNDRRLSYSASSDALYVNLINLPRSVSGSGGGGAEAENNRLMLSVYGFRSGRLKIEQSVSALPSVYRLRGKTADPTSIARYLAAFLNRVAAEVPPKFTHSR